MTEIVQTRDGSHSVLNKTLDETYHSWHGAINEALHVFIEAGLLHHQKKDIRILEIGFGTGLNALLTYIEAEKLSLNIDYTGIEFYPVAMDIVDNLNFAEILGQRYQTILETMHQIAQNKKMAISPNFSLQKLEEDFSKMKLEESYDVIYFDAFSPDKQPEMWTEERFQTLYEHTFQAGSLTTYSAKGDVRRKLQKVGYQVEKLPGPKGKREILRAIKK